MIYVHYCESFHYSDISFNFGEHKCKIDCYKYGFVELIGELLDDKITEFSEDDTDVELSMNENALDIFFGECVYEDGLSEEIGFDVDHMLSFFSVDFYIHETQTSNILSGKNPMYNFQLTFRVNVDEHLLNYLESDYIYIEV